MFPITQSKKHIPSIYFFETIVFSDIYFKLCFQNAKGNKLKLPGVLQMLLKLIFDE